MTLALIVLTAPFKYNANYWFCYQAGLGPEFEFISLRLRLAYFNADPKCSDVTAQQDPGRVDVLRAQEARRQPADHRREYVPGRRAGIDAVE